MLFYLSLIIGLRDTQSKPSCGCKFQHILDRLLTTYPAALALSLSLPLFLSANKIWGVGELKEEFARVYMDGYDALRSTSV